ncbi:MAG TPA: hypothetical protein PLR18_00570 [bacterium]|nr:hypothetical protein [bacterium]
MNNKKQATVIIILVVIILLFFIYVYKNVDLATVTKFIYNDHNATPVSNERCGQCVGLATFKSYDLPENIKIEDLLDRAVANNLTNHDPRASNKSFSVHQTVGSDVSLDILFTEYLKDGKEGIEFNISSEGTCLQGRKFMIIDESKRIFKILGLDESAIDAIEGFYDNHIMCSPEGY